MVSTKSQIIKVLAESKSPLARKTIQKRLKLKRRDARYQMNRLLEDGTIRRVMPLETGSKKVIFNRKTVGVSKDEKDKQRRERKKTYSKSWKMKNFNVFVLV
jgi:repressor of nif and glnA expression